MDLLNVLMDFNPDTNWQDKLDDIKDAVDDYNKAIAKKDDRAGEYLDGVLPGYWQIVREHNTRQFGGQNCLPINSHYDVGIFLVGYSSLPIVLSIAEIQPRQRIYFIHSSDTAPECERIKLRIQQMLTDSQLPCYGLINPPDAESLIERVQSAEKWETADPSDPVSTFKEIKKIIDNVRSDFENGAKIALDLTGGKKTMIGGGFTAGSIYSLSPKCDMFYVDSSEYDPDRGAPKPGTEFLSELKNPYEVYNVQSVGQAKELFKQHNYEASAQLWEDVYEKLEDYAERYELEGEQEAVEKYLYMSDCYGFWDAFDYLEAKCSKVNHGDLWGYDTKHICNSIDVLEILSAAENRQTLFAEESQVIHYAIDRYQNGKRRVASDRFDDAIVRFTQVVEILCLYQVYQIATRRLLTDNHGRIVSSDDCLDEHWRMWKLIVFLFGQSRYEKDRDNHYYIQDQEMQLDIGAYGCYCDATEITDLIEARHDFVHLKNSPGWEVMRENSENLEDLARKFLENFSDKYRCENGLSFDELLKLHRFESVK